MVVIFLLLVGDVDGDEVGILGIVHLNDLLLVGVLALGPVERRLGLLALALYLLADGIVLRLDLAQVRVGPIPLLLQLLGILNMALAQFFEPGANDPQGLGNTPNQVVSVFLVLVGSRLEGSEMGGPCRERGTGASQKHVSIRLGRLGED